MMLPDTDLAATDSKRVPTAAAIEMLRANSLATLAQRELERQIVSGELPVGAKLNESDIAGSLGVSRGPVREAFRALDQAGLVRVEKNRGVFVRQVSLEEANEIYEVRAALEGLIGRLAAQRASGEEIDRLRAVVRRMRSTGRGGRAAAYYPLNVEFHELLAQAAHNATLLANYRRVVNQLELYRRETLTHSADNIPISTSEHHEIVDAVAARDAAHAERLAFDHVIQSRERLHRALAELPQSGHG